MKTVIAATDLSRRGALAIDRAAVIARGTGAELFIVHAVDNDQPRELMEREIEQAERLLSAEVAGLDRPQAKYRIVTGDIYLAVHVAAKEAEAEMIVAGDHRRSPLRDAFRDTTIERLIRHSSIPVLVARLPVTGTYRHAVIGVETEEAAELIPLLHSLGEMAPQRMTALSAFDAFAAGMMANVGADREQIGIHHQECADEARERLRSSIPMEHRQDVDLTVTEADPAIALQNFAEDEGCDLIAVSTHARRGLLRGLLGSVTSELIRHGSVDLLILPRIG